MGNYAIKIRPNRRMKIAHTVIIAVIMFISGGLVGMDRQQTADFDRYQGQMLKGEIICFYDDRSGKKVYAVPHDENWNPLPRKTSQTACGMCHEGH